MRITFVLPFDGRKPVGGFKVVYEYANFLVSQGHSVCLVHPAGLYLGVSGNDRFFRNIAKYFYYLLGEKYRPVAWFSLDKRIKIRWVPSLSSCFIPRSDAIIATAWETAEWVAFYPMDRGRKYYLIQHFEDWFGDRGRLLNTWRLPLEKIVISKWLGKIANSIGERFNYIPNGLDHEAFGLDVAPDQRDPKHILMLYHHLEWKGTQDGLAALSMVRAQIPDIRVILYGVDPPEKVILPEWASSGYVQLPSRHELRQLYNQAAIFVGPSWSEGWGLPPSEAMQCGCATVLTDIGGHREFAEHGVTSLLCAIKAPEQMAKNILALLEDDNYRIRLATAAAQKIKKFDWRVSGRTLERLLSEAQ